MRRILLSLLAALMLLAGGGWWYLSRPFSAVTFVTAAPHPATIYDTAAPHDLPLLSPFDLAIDPMDQLLLANFTGDPDSVYVGFEPQSFKDDVHGTGLLVIGWRTDGRVDVFHTPGLRLDSATYGIAGSGLHAMVERPFENARFVIDATGPDVALTFDDLLGRAVRLDVRESARPPRRTFGLLAPMGDAAAKPPALPLVLLHEFDFVRVSGSEVLLTIDGTFHRLDRLPLRLNGARRWFLRYSPDPFIVTWNTERDTVRVVAVPDGWTPNEPNRTVRLIYRLGGVFTMWPASYRYDAVLTRTDSAGSRIRCGWTRVPVTPES